MEAPAMIPDPLELRLDEALEATFPASDPIAVSPPHVTNAAAERVTGVMPAQ